MLKQEQEVGGANSIGGGANSIGGGANSIGGGANSMVAPGDIKADPGNIKDEPRENGTDSIFDDNLPGTPLDSKDNSEYEYNL